MSQIEATITEAGAAEAAVEHVGPGRRTYVLIAVVLAVLTLLETQMPHWLAGNLTLLAYALIAGTILKAGLVALYYMHLKFDAKVYSGIVLLALFLVFYFLWLISYGHLGLIWQQPPPA
jgi:cytochrome c oxidase subunit 4